MNILAFVLARLKEPSSYAGAGALLAAAGVHVNNGVLQAAIQALVAFAGLVAMLLPEKMTAERPLPR
ncbi:MAG: hypothetical protein ACREE2_00855 [Stellaceae bacterium]